MTRFHRPDRRGFLAQTGALTAGLSFAPAILRAQDARDYILATATTGGTYYPVGVAIATVTKTKLQPSQGINVSAINSAGSGENVKLLREDQAQFAILQGLYGKWARNGSGPLAGEGPQEYLRSVSMLWQNVEHFTVAREQAKTGTIADIGTLDGSFSIGARNSGTEGSGREILGNLGIDPDSLDLVFQGYGPSAEALQNGTIAGMNTPAGVPVGAVTQAFAALGDSIVVLDFTDEQIAEANGDDELWTRYTIPAETYPEQSQDINTMAQPNFLGVRADVDEDAVYQITKTMYDSLPVLNSIHAATRAMSLDAAIAGLPAPLHAGALRYYEEQGLDIPERLRA